jgi:hypothetical protein
MAAHAILSPSGASRWLACTPSARLEQQFPDSAGAAAKEGTLAHALGELIIRHKLGLINEVIYDQAILEIEASDLFDSSMMEHAENYGVFVLERYSDAQAHTSDALIYLEQRLNLTDYVPEGFGTGDVVIIADSVLDLIDLKYGKGVPVSAEENKQMMLYALGALREFDYMYDIDRVRMTIYQPRIDNFSSWEIPVTTLREWAETELKPRAALAFDGLGEYAPGSHCRFCRAKAVCKAHAEMHLGIAQYDFKNADLLTDDEVSDILSRADAFKNWITAVEDHALTEAVNNGKHWPGYKLVEGRSNRKYQDETIVASKLLEAGFKEEVIYKKEILGITAMEKAIGKKVFAAHLSDMIIKPAGKPTLAPLSDKRPEYNSCESAVNDFSN